MFDVVVFVIIFIGLGLFALHGIIKQKDGWQALPTLDEYLTTHPECKKGNGIRCHSCGGGSIKNWGVFGPDSEERKFICNGCGSELYRK
jgi:hypothetical protein